MAMTFPSRMSRSPSVMSWMPYATSAVGVSSIIWTTFLDSAVLSWSSTAMGMLRMAPCPKRSAKNANDTTGRMVISTRYIG